MVYVNALPCKTQMLQIVTLHGDYQYQIAHFFYYKFHSKCHIM